MPIVEGTVSQINVTDTYCCVTVDESGGGSTTVLLWSYQSQADDARNRLTHGTYLALTRDAYINNKTISFTHPAASGIVNSVLLSGS